MSMIINTQTKGYQMQSTRNYPENWEGEGWLPVPPELEGKVRENYPYYELVIEDGALVDVTPTERPEEPEDPTPPGGDLEQRVTTLEATSATKADVQAVWDEMAAAYTEGVNSI